MNLQEIQKETGIDALLVTDPYNMRYLSGFRGGEGILYLSGKRSVLITDSRYTEAARQESSFDVLEENQEHRRPELLQACLEQDGARTVGYEDQSLRCCEFDRFRAELPLVKEWIPLQGQIDQLRRIKTPEEQELLAKDREFMQDDLLEAEFAEYMAGKENPRYEKLKDTFTGRLNAAAEARDQAFQTLMDARGEYARKYPNRNFSITSRDNREYEKLMEILECDHLEEYRQIAAEQARSAVEHFKDDFMFKIRSAIREALQRKDELNRIISRLDFGKDKYQFVIGKNKGADGRFYDMFMDDSLEVNPNELSEAVDNQMNLFTMEHESQYGELIEELINVFIPPDNATPEQMEEAKRNMDKYADYRTYLSFDMQQLIQNEDEVIRIRLSKMIKKNSGGEGQNPLYVALLASFAQAYRISMPESVRRNPTIRLVVLDEAFSKMDAEKVASCIELIRGLGFQAIISATNDKIQNYVENVDKTFVFANPNKKSISIQEFERESFPQLMKELDEGEEDD